MILFPLLPPWRYTPHGWLAAIVWNVSEILHFPAPYAPTLFGWIVDKRGKRCPEKTNANAETKT